MANQVYTPETSEYTSLNGEVPVNGVIRKLAKGVYTPEEIQPSEDGRIIADEVVNDFINTQDRTLGLGATIIDSFGLKSVSAFVSGELTDMATRVITSTNWVTVDNTTLVIPKLTRRTRVLIFYNAIITLDFPSSGGISGGNIDLNLDGINEVGNSFNYGIYDSSISLGAGHQYGRNYSHTGIGMKDLAEGEHTIKLVAKCSYSDGNHLHVDNTDISYIILGK